MMAWGAEQRPHLPWRLTDDAGRRDPYRVWVAEIMLQQTTAATVGPYFERFLARFPTIAALAAAPLDDVLKAWEGLGYYARARNLHHAAQVIVRDHGGVLPDDPKTLAKLPGIGRYTLGAILSIAFGQRAPILDGNVRRVLARVFAVEEDARAPATERRLWALAEALVAAADSPGAFNEGLMDLGALICVPGRPRCLACPVADLCQAYALGIQERLPALPPRKQTPHYDVTAGVIWRGETFLVAQRPLDKMLGGLWEFPGGKCDAGETLQECLRRELREELDIEVAVGAHLTTVRHAYTHFRITLHAFHCAIVAGEPRTVEVADIAWTTLADVDRFAMAVTDGAIVAALRKEVATPGRKGAQGEMG
ncbi:MAG: A/G-specific adenine glycosylase [Anaerolineae bacterium]